MESPTILTTRLGKTVASFFAKWSKSDLPYLVAFSGGSDSSALVHAMREEKIPFHLAHFDHRMRASSGKEAKTLSNWAEREGIPLHLGRAERPLKGELAAREARYAFLRSLCTPPIYRGLVLAHHREDQAETVLKRVFEGAPLASMGAMREESSYEGIPLMRPLLSVPKGDILAYLDEHAITYIEDETNQDPIYLRSRLRHELIPALSKQFGKEVAPALCRMGKRGQQLRDYLDRQIAKFQMSSVEGPYGLAFDFAPHIPLEEVEVFHFLRSYLPGVGESFLSMVAALLSSRAANKKASFGGTHLEIDRGRLYMIRRQVPEFPKGDFPLEPGTIESGDWQWEITISKSEGGEVDWWRGKTSWKVPKSGSLRRANTREKKRLSTAKIPAFLWSSLPVVQSDGSEGENWVEIAFKGGNLLA